MPDTSGIPPEGLKAPLHVGTDSNLIHSIFAKNLHDLYYAQGYLTAKQRLWQMEFQTFAAAGRLSELVGDKALEYDRFQRRFGMVWAAEKALDSAMHDPETAEALKAYSEGVNAYIENLGPREYQLEYRLLDYAPEPWSPLKSMLLLKYMAFDLSGHSDDLYLSNIARKLGLAATDSLFPNRLTNPDPIIPKGTPWKFKDTEARLLNPAKEIEKSLGTAGLAPSENTGKEEPLKASFAGDFVGPFKQPENDDASEVGSSKAVYTSGEAISQHKGYRANPANGSNNWALSGKYTQTGYPLLSNDPHLGLNLPSLWYVVQLSAPGFNCAGVSLPGAPGIIIGFNDSITWGVTNTGADVLDFYAMDIPKVKGVKANKQYRDAAGQLQNFILRPETIIVRGGETVYDTMRIAPQGPVTYLPDEKPFHADIPPGYAVRWAAHDASNELRTFLRLNKARNFSDFNEALRTYSCPAQNFAYADAAGNIAMRVMGRFPKRRVGQGKYLLNANKPEDAWQERVPENENPVVLNPPRGYVSSANQVPADSTYPYYLGADFATSYRGSRINERLHSFTEAGAAPGVKEMGEMQSDAFSLHAKTMLPVFLRYADMADLTPPQRKVMDDLRRWNYIFSPESKAAEMFNLWWERVMYEIWEPSLGGGDLSYPSRELTARLILSDTASWRYDKPETPQREYLRHVVQFAFTMAWRQRPSPKDAKEFNLQWTERKGTGLRHLARLAPLSRLNLYCGGAKGTINALSDNHGPSWRMNVQTGPKPFMLCIYPGGQSGNPGSRYYDNFVELWRKGRFIKTELKKR